MFPFYYVIASRAFALYGDAISCRFGDCSPALHQTQCGASVAKEPLAVTLGSICHCDEPQTARAFFLTKQSHVRGLSYVIRRLLRAIALAMTLCVEHFFEQVFPFRIDTQY
jgi:hypothetical protein